MEGTVPYGNKCILQLRGVRPFLSDKFDIKQHPRHKYLDEADKNNRFDITEYMKSKTAVPKPEQEFEYFEYKGLDNSSEKVYSISDERSQK